MSDKLINLQFVTTHSNLLVRMFNQKRHLRMLNHFKMYFLTTI